MYIIYGISNYGREEIDTAETRKEAEYLVREYQIAFGRGWSFEIREGLE